MFCKSPEVTLCGWRSYNLYKPSWINKQATLAINRLGRCRAADGCERFPLFKSGVGVYVILIDFTQHALRTARASSLQISAFSVHSTSFSPKPLQIKTEISATVKKLWLVIRIIVFRPDITKLVTWNNISLICFSRKHPTYSVHVRNRKMITVTISWRPHRVHSGLRIHQHDCQHWVYSN